MAETASDDLLQDLDKLRVRVRGAQRSDSAPLLTFGVLIALFAGVPLLGVLFGAGPVHSLLLAYWPLATAAGLLVLWWAARRRMVRDGVGEGRGDYAAAIRTYLLVLLVIAVAFIPALLIGVFMPLIWPAIVLIVLAVWQRSRALYAWAAVIGVVGGTASILAAAEVGGEGLGWWYPTLHAAAGLAMIAGGLAARRRERAVA